MLHLVIDNKPSVDICRERITTSLECAADELDWCKQWLAHVDAGLLQPDLQRAIELIRSIKKHVSP